MFKLSLKTVLLCSIVVAQCPSIHAGAGGYNFDFRRAFVDGAVTGGKTTVALGCIYIALTKAYLWGRSADRSKMLVGRTILGATVAGAILGIGYTARYMQKG